MLIYVTQTSLRDSCGLGREHRRKRNSHQQNWRLFLSAGKKATVFIFLDDDCFYYFKGGPEPLEKESHEFLGSKRDDRFSNPFF